MKWIHVLAAMILMSLASAASVHAQSPREQLGQMVEQLQKAPTDDALRERIIKLGAEIKPAPAIPDEAVRYTGRAIFVFKTAKTEADYLDAAREYERAVTSAPWVASYYAELCTIYENATKYAEAKRACDFALVGTTDPSQAMELKQRIAGLEIGIERNSAAGHAKPKQSEFLAFLESIEGHKFRTEPLNQSGAFLEIRIVHGELVTGINGDEQGWRYLETYRPTGYVYEAKGTCGTDDFTCTSTYHISLDGNSITRTYRIVSGNGPLPGPLVYRRLN